MSMTLDYVNSFYSNIPSMECTGHRINLLTADTSLASIKLGDGLCAHAQLSTATVINTPDD